MPRATEKYAVVLLAITLLPHASSADSPDAARARNLIQELAAEDFATRARAEESLLDLPPEVLPLLESAIDDAQTAVDVRERLEFVAGRLRRADRSKRMIDAAARDARAYATRIQKQYTAHGQHGPWDQSVLQGIARRTIPTTELWGQPTLRRACKHFEDALDAGCGDPLPVFLLLLSRQQLRDADDFADRIEPLPEALERQGYEAAIVSRAYAERARARWEMLGPTEPRAARRAATPDLGKAVEAFLNTTPQQFETPTEQISCAKVLARLMLQIRPDDAMAEIRRIVDRLAPPDRDDAFAVALRAQVMNATDLIVSAKGSTFNATTRSEAAEAHALAHRVVSESRFDQEGLVLRARYATAHARGQVSAATEICEELLRLDHKSGEIVSSQMMLLFDLRDADALQRLADVVLTHTDRTTYTQLIYAEIQWHIGAVNGNAPGYIAQPAVWQQIEDIYQQHFRHFGNDRTAHAHIAWYAYRAGRLELAKKHFDAAGDDGDDPITPSMTDYEYYRLKTDQAVSE